MPSRPTWAEVSLPTLRKNFRTIREHVAPSAEVCAVVKAHAYGHGAAECSRALQAEGAKWFGVTSTEEGASLRDAGITGRVLLMTGFWRGEEEEVVRRDLTPAVWTREHVQLLEDAARKLGRNGRLPVHLKVDTGMARLGVSMDALEPVLQAFSQARLVSMEGLFTHLASSEVVDAPSVSDQLARFAEAVRIVCLHGFSPARLHVANSSAVVACPQSWKNLVRPGLSLYGYYLPFVSATGVPSSLPELPVSPVLSWKTRIISLRDVPAGQALGYGGAYVTKAPSRIAALPVGYADGYNRRLSSRGRVIVRDRYAGITGNISMDLTLIDVTGIPGVDLGDEVVLIGSSSNCRITAADLAQTVSTIPYEVLCNISKRVPRIYLEQE